MSKLQPLFDLSPELLSKIEKSSFKTTLARLAKPQAQEYWRMPLRFKSIDDPTLVRARQPYIKILEEARSRRKSADPRSMAVEAVQEGAVDGQKLSAKQRRNIAYSIALSDMQKATAGNLDTSLFDVAGPGWFSHDYVKNTTKARDLNRVLIAKRHAFNNKWVPGLTLDVNNPSDRFIKDKAALTAMSNITENARPSRTVGRIPEEATAKSYDYRDWAMQELGLWGVPIETVYKIKAALKTVGKEASPELRQTILTLGQGWTGTRDELIEASRLLS